MRTIKLIILGLVAVVLVTLGVANMAPVDLYLLPARLAGTNFVVSSVPLAAVILAAMLFGVVVGEFLEWVRERKHRRTAAERSREIDRLRREVALMKSRFGEMTDELPKIPAR